MTTSPQVNGQGNSQSFLCLLRLLCSSPACRNIIAHDWQKLDPVILAEASRRSDSVQGQFCRFQNLELPHDAAISGRLVQIGRAGAPNIEQSSLSEATPGDNLRRLP